MRWLLSLVILLSVSISGHAGSAAGFMWASNVGSITKGWSTLPVGGGGDLTGFVIACDQGQGQCSAGVGTVTRMVRTDVGGAVYWYNPATIKCGNANRTGCWQNIFTPANFPGLTLYNADTAARDMAVSPANTQIVYIYIGQNGCLYKSTTGPNGTYSALSGFTCTSYFSTNPGDGGQHHLLADPNNANVLYVAAPANQGAFVSTDGGTTFTNTSSLFPTSGSGTGNSAIYAFDTSNGTSGTCPGSSCRTNNVFSCVNGTGIYKSVNGGAAFTELNSSGMPTTCFHIDVDAKGVLWLTDSGSNNLYTWTPTSVGSTSGTWTKVLTASGNGGVHFAIDYNTACTSGCRVIASSYEGYLNETDNGGSTWSGANTHFTTAATDAPWMAAGSATFINTSVIYFDPTQSNILDVAAGAGFWTTPPPGNSSSAFVYTSLTVDIEEIVSTRIIDPPGLNPVMAGWDRGVWSLQSQTSYPSYYGPNQSVTENRAWDVAYSGDYASTGLIVQISYSGFGFYANNLSNGNPANWTEFTAQPNQVSVNGSNSTAFGGGNIVALNSTDWVWKIGSDGDVFTTVDAGAHWLKLTPTGVPVSAAGLTNATTSTSQSTLSFSAAAGYIDAGFIASLAAGNSVGVYDLTTQCSVGTATSATSSVVTLSANSACPVGSGDAIQMKYTSNNGPGWQAGGEATPQNLILDRQTSNVAYIYNGSTQAPGIYKLYVSGGTIHAVLVYSGSLGGGAASVSTLVGVPSTAGDMYFTASINGGSLPVSGSLYECLDSNPGGTSSGTMTCTAVTTANSFGANVSSVIVIGAGKAKSGGSGYSAFEFYGSIDGSTVGVYRTYDHFQTFTEVAGNQFQGVISGDSFPGRYDQPASLAGSSDTQGLFQLCFWGTACVYSQFPYLLNRDLDPASNDNSPAWLDRAA